MLPRSSLTSTATFVLVLWACMYLELIGAQRHTTTARPPTTHDSDAKDEEVTKMQMKCRPFGPCEPCPDDALHEPFCQPFGNRRLVHCVAVPPSSPPRLTTSHSNTHSHITSPHSPHVAQDNQQPEGETPAWESCGRIVEVERADFWEFVACNVFFAAVALGLVIARSKRLEAVRTRTLAARIGLLRGGGSR